MPGCKGEQLRAFVSKYLAPRQERSATVQRRLRQNRHKAMDIELTDDERKIVLQALEHYDAYLYATNRKDGKAAELAERLRGHEAATRTAVESIKRKVTHRGRNG